MATVLRLNRVIKADKQAAGGPIMLKWVWIGVSRTFAGFSLLSLVFSEQWSRGWLSWLLKHWQALTHNLTWQIGIHLNTVQERAWILVIIMSGVALTGYITDAGGWYLKGASSRRKLIGLAALLACVALIPADVALRQAVRMPVADASNYFLFGVVLVVLFVFALGSPRAFALTLGSAAALLALNLGLSATGILPPPS